MYTLNTAEETTPTNKTYQTGNLIPLNFSTNKFKNNPDFDQKLFYFYAIFIFYYSDSIHIEIV